MSPDQDPPSQADIERRRVPLERKVSLKFKEFRGFIIEISHNVSLGGMFIATASPKPPGTIFDFELSLTDDFKLVQGIGEVVWVREADAGPGHPPGMGVRFLDLSPESRRLVQRIVEEHVGRGGVAFDLEPAPFPPPPLRTSQQQPRLGPPLPVFHPTAAPMAPPPPATSRPSRPPAPSPAGAEPAAAEARPSAISPEAPTTRLPRAAAALWGTGRGPERLELAGGLPDLTPPELPVPELLPPLDESPTPERGLAGDEDLAGDEGLAGDEDLAGDEESGAGAAPPPGIAPAAGPARAGTELSEGFAQVARVFGYAPAPSETDDTVRLARFAPPSSLAAPSAAPTEWERTALGQRSPPASEAAPAPPSASTLPEASPARRMPRAAPRRSRWPLAAGLVLLVGAAAAVGALYLRFPELLPAWAPGAPAPAPAEERVRFTHPRQASPEELAARSVPPNAPVAPAGSVPAGEGDTPAGGAATARGAPPAEPAAPRFSTIEEIWGQRNAAGTMVTLVADGAVPQGSFTHAHLDGGKPREVVYLRGVAGRFERGSVAVGTPEVSRVRTGYHVKPGGNELHVVIDLASSDVRLIRAVAVDNRIELLFGR